MLTNIPLRCTCGAVRGLVRDVDGTRGNRVVCMCDDCQAFAHWLGRADDMLDRCGGTDVFQVTPAQIELTCGKENLRCMRLSDRGMVRWYTACCRTPVANQLPSPRMPFAGIPQPFMDHAADGRTRDEVLGPPLAYVHARYATAPPPANAHPKAPLRLVFRILPQLAKGLLRRANLPSPFVDASTLHFVREPQVLTPQEREQLRLRR